jgi:hypothetical protein
VDLGALKRLIAAVRVLRPSGRILVQALTALLGGMTFVERDEVESGGARSNAVRDIPSGLSMSSVVKSYHFYHRGHRDHRFQNRSSKALLILLPSEC